MYPNAKSGIGKLLVAEIIALSVAVVTILTALLALLAISQLNQNLLAVAGVLGIIVGLAALVCLIVRIIGLIDAGKDEKAFKTALYCVLGALGIAVLNFILGLAKVPSIVTTIFGVIQNALTLLCAVYCIFGVRNLANQVNRPDVADFSRIALYCVCGAQVFGIILSLVSGFIPGVASQVMSLISAIVALVAEVVFIMLLGKGKKMLA